ncbi:MAG: prepilin-type N-terminal cleavage/methylation domain-containing protein [Gemmatimonadales bacterium]
MGRARQAFTVLELLAIMAIIAILASVAIDRGKRARERTNVTTMITDLRNW